MSSVLPTKRNGEAYRRHQCEEAFGLALLIAIGLAGALAQSLRIMPLIGAFDHGLA